MTDEIHLVHVHEVRPGPDESRPGPEVVEKLRKEMEEFEAHGPLLAVTRYSHSWGLMFTHGSIALSDDGRIAHVYSDRGKGGGDQREVVLNLLRREAAGD